MKSTFLIPLLLIVGFLILFSLSSCLSKNGKISKPYKIIYKIENKTDSSFDVEILKNTASGSQDMEEEIVFSSFELGSGEEKVFHTAESASRDLPEAPALKPELTETFISNNQPKGSYVAEEYHRVVEDKFTVIHKWTYSYKSTDEWLKSKEGDF